MSLSLIPPLFYVADHTAGGDFVKPGSVFFLGYDAYNIHPITNSTFRIEPSGKLEHTYIVITGVDFVWRGNSVLADVPSLSFGFFAFYTQQFMELLLGTLYVFHSGLSRGTLVTCDTGVQDQLMFAVNALWIVRNQHVTVAV